MSDSSKSNSPTLSKRLIRLLWDVWCITSIIGIWPRYIEPVLLSTTRLKIPLKGISIGCNPTILQLSDIHLHQNVPNHFLQRLIKKATNLNPDIITITGDLLCHSTVDDPDRLLNLLQQLRKIAPIYVALGNHDYAQYLRVNAQGNYDIGGNKGVDIVSGFARLFKKLQPTGYVLPAARAIQKNPVLTALLEKADAKLLHNETIQTTVNKQRFNITGVGEHIGNQCDPHTAFQQFDSRYPGIVLAHNPDAIPSLLSHSGNLILSGHTHGGAVRLPGVWQRITVLENKKFIKGLHVMGDKIAYISRGLGGGIAFRWFCTPEMVHITLTSEDK